MDTDDDDWNGWIHDSGNDLLLLLLLFLFVMVVVTVVVILIVHKSWYL